MIIIYSTAVLIPVPLHCAALRIRPSKRAQKACTCNSVWLSSIEKGSSESETKAHVSSIHELKEKLKKETDNLKEIKRRLKDLQDRQREEKEASQGLTAVKGNAELRQMVEV